MLLDPYLTTIALAYPRAALQKAVVAESIHRTNRNNLMVIGEDDKEVSEFTQPLLFTQPAARIPTVAVDLRAYKGNNGYMVEQRDLMRLRAALTLHAARQETAGDFYQPAAQAAYANLIAGIVAHKFGIAPALKMYVTVVAAAHYYNMTHEGTPGAEYGDSERMMLTGQLVRLLKAPTDIVDAVLGKVVYGDNLAALADNIRRVDDTDRTKDLSSGLMVNGAAGLWIGVAATETLSVAFEHAPTFCALLYAALGEGSYSRGEMAKQLKYVQAAQKNAVAFRQTMRQLQLAVDDTIGTDDQSRRGY